MNLTLIYNAAKMVGLSHELTAYILQNILCLTIRCVAGEFGALIGKLKQFFDTHIKKHSHKAERTGIELNQT